MVRIIMHGCNGKMGQVIRGLLEGDSEAKLVAGIDMTDDKKSPYPVYTDIGECNVEADCLVDFSTAAAVDKMLDYCVERKLPCVLCTTGLSPEQLSKVDEAAKSIALLRSANMSLGINLFLKLLKNAAGVLAPAGFDMERIYREAFGMEDKMLQSMKADIEEKFKVASEAFQGAPQEDTDFLHMFAFICLLGFDVYLKKLMIEKMIDELAANRQEQGKKKAHKAQGEEE